MKKWSIQLAPFWWHFFWAEKCQNFCIWMGAYRAWISPKKKWSCASCLPLEPHMPPDIKENTKQTKKHNNYFLPFSGSKQSLPGAFCYQNLCWKTKLNTEFKLKVQNPNLKSDPLIWVWNSLFFFFWGKSLFCTREDSWSPWSQPKPEDRTNFIDKISQKVEEKLNFWRKTTQNSPRLCKGEGSKGIFLQLQVRKKELTFLYIYL